MEFLGFNWFSMEFSGISMGFNEIPMGVHAISMGFLWAVVGFYNVNPMPKIYLKLLIHSDQCK